MNNVNVFRLVFLILGIVFTGIGALLYSLWQKNLHHRNITTTGTIVGYKEDYDDGVTYAPIVVFVNDQGQEVEGISNVSKSKNLLGKYQIGQQVSIRYDALKEEDILIEGYDTGMLKWMGYLFGGLGIFFLILGTVVASIL